jgi:hypothetical protein
MRRTAGLLCLPLQVAQGRMYTSLATGRIQELSAEIEPLRVSRAAAQTEIARLEALQVKGVPLLWGLHRGRMITLLVFSDSRDHGQHSQSMLFCSSCLTTSS